MILYSFRRCPYAIRARMTLQYSGLEYTLIEVDLKNKPEELLLISPKGTVPVLQFLDNSIIEESLDILYWSLTQNDPEDWLIQNDSLLNTESERLIQNNDQSFKPLLDRYKYANRYPEQTPEEHRDKASSFLKQLDDKLSLQPFLLRSNISIADIALFPFVRQYAFVNKNWFDQAPYPNLQRWFQYFMDSPLFQNIM